MSAITEFGDVLAAEKLLMPRTVRPGVRVWLPLELFVRWAHETSTLALRMATTRAFVREMFAAGYEDIEVRGRTVRALPAVRDPAWWDVTKLSSGWPAIWRVSKEFAGGHLCGGSADVSLKERVLVDGRYVKGILPRWMWGA
jgi:hypothetical protein